MSPDAQLALGDVEAALLEETDRLRAQMTEIEAEEMAKPYPDTKLVGRLQREQEAVEAFSRNVMRTLTRRIGASTGR